MDDRHIYRYRQPGRSSMSGATPGELAEYRQALSESRPYMIWYEKATEPIICECCGSTVVAVPEAECQITPYRWVRAIWELAPCRKHTRRRCDWQRDQYQ